MISEKDIYRVVMRRGVELRNGTLAQARGQIFEVPTWKGFDNFSLSKRQEELG